MTGSWPEPVKPVEELRPGFRAENADVVIADYRSDILPRWETARATLKHWSLRWGPGHRSSAFRKDPNRVGANAALPEPQL